MNTHFVLPPLLLVLLLSVSGCKALSERAHRLGRALDPDIQRCDAVPNCPLCGENRPGPGYPHAPGGCENGCPPQAQGISDPYASGNNLNIEQELMSIREQANRSEMMVNQMRGELVGRNDDLIQARADYSRITNDLSSMRSDLTAWQNETQRLQQTLKNRDKQRLATLDEMADTLANITADIQ